MPPKFTITLQDLILQRCVETRNHKKLDSPNSSVATETRSHTTVSQNQELHFWTNVCIFHSSFIFQAFVPCSFMYSQILETNCKGVFVIKFKLQITVFLKFRLEFRPKIGSFNLGLNFMHLWQHCSRDLLV